MKKLLAFGALPFVCLCGQIRAMEPVTLRSHSGQFLVRGLPVGAPRVSPSTNILAYIRLDPALFAVSCERIKEAVLGELGAKDVWKGKIFVSVHPVKDDHEPIVITATHYTDGWSYHMDIPEMVDGPRLIKSVVEVLLQEMANRDSRSRLAAELPLWLPEGFAAHLQATILSNFTLEPETRINRGEKGADPLAHAREYLRAHPPLSLDDLNWPTEEQFSGNGGETYRCCAQLFVYELLRLPDGRSCLREMLARLTENLNWQTAFLQAFGAHFQRLLDLDKWWSLHLVHLIGQGFASAWMRPEFCQQLQDILTTSVQVRLSPVELPLTTQVKLQIILGEWEFPRQQPTLREMVTRLKALRLRASAEFIRLVDDYRQTLETYVQRRRDAGGSTSRVERSPKSKFIVSETIKRLDDLDARLAVLRTETNAPAQFTITR